MEVDNTDQGVAAEETEFQGDSSIPEFLDGVDNTTEIINTEDSFRAQAKPNTESCIEHFTVNDAENNGLTEKSKSYSLLIEDMLLKLITAENEIDQIGASTGILEESNSVLSVPTRKIGKADFFLHRIAGFQPYVAYSAYDSLLEEDDTFPVLSKSWDNVQSYIAGNEENDENERVADFMLAVEAVVDETSEEDITSEAGQNILSDSHPDMSNEVTEENVQYAPLESVEAEFATDFVEESESPNVPTQATGIPAGKESPAEVPETITMTIGVLPTVQRMRMSPARQTLAGDKNRSKSKSPSGLSKTAPKNPAPLTVKTVQQQQMKITKPQTLLKCRQSPSPMITRPSTCIGLISANPRAQTPKSACSSRSKTRKLSTMKDKRMSGLTLNLPKSSPQPIITPHKILITPKPPITGNSAQKAKLQPSPAVSSLGSRTPSLSGLKTTLSKPSLSYVEIHQHKKVLADATSKTVIGWAPGSTTRRQIGKMGRAAVARKLKQ